MLTQEQRIAPYAHFFRRCDVCSKVLPEHLYRVGVCSEACAHETGDEKIESAYRIAQLELKAGRSFSSRGPCAVCGKPVPKSKDRAPQLRPILRAGYCSRECAEEAGAVARPTKSQSRYAIESRLRRTRKTLLAETPEPLSSEQEEIVGQMRDVHVRLRWAYKQYSNSLSAFMASPRNKLLREYLDTAYEELAARVAEMRQRSIELEFTPNASGGTLPLIAWGALALALAAVAASAFKEYA